MATKTRQILPCSKEDIQAALAKSTNPKGDAFAKTFIGKADKQEMWDNCHGVYEGDELLGMSIVTVSTRAPIVMNMQLLHTFWDHRKKGVGKALVDDAFKCADSMGVDYFRVSAEQTAAVFYAKCGIVFSGFQKSGTLLSLMPLKSDVPGHYVDEFMRKKFMTANGKLDRHRTLYPNTKDAAIIEQLGESYQPFYASSLKGTPIAYEDAVLTLVHSVSVGELQEAGTATEVGAPTENRED